MRVDYHPAVEVELREIRQYYEERSPGLGIQFIDELERQVLALAATPERWMIVTGEIRRCLMRRFPYIIYFRRVGADSIRVTVVKHQRRHPDYGRDRK
jgi:toxin ParE1/3/4